MSLVSGQISQHENHRSDRRRARLHVESMWSDAAAQKFLHFLDEFEQEDRYYGQALGELDLAFDQADKLLGPI
jgi:hypothetical protein